MGDFRKGRGTPSDGQVIIQGNDEITGEGVDHNMHDAILHQHGPPTNSEDISTLPGSGKDKKGGSEDHGLECPDEINVEVM